MSDLRIDPLELGLDEKLTQLRNKLILCHSAMNLIEESLDKGTGRDIYCGIEDTIWAAYEDVQNLYKDVFPSS